MTKLPQDLDIAWGHPGERWRWIPGWERYYMVSSHGRIVAVARKIVDSAGRCREYKSRFLRPCINRQSQYRQVMLSLGERVEKWVFHRAIAEAFLENPYGLQFVNHIDGDRGNNRLDNLEWISPQGNARHAVDTGLNGAAKLSAAQVRHVRRCHGEFIADLAVALGVTRTAVMNIITSKTWAHIKSDNLSHSDSAQLPPAPGMNDTRVSRDTILELG